mgnify:CR=1 FL=1
MEEGQELVIGQDMMDEISCDQMQEVIDRLLGSGNFHVTKYLSGLLQGKQAISWNEIVQTISRGILGNLQQERRMIVYLLLLALVGAVFSNFSKLLQGKQVAETAFLAVYLLFFSVLGTSFLEIAGMASNTVGHLLEFMKALVPAYFISMTFSQGGAAAGVYYEFTLVLMMVVDGLLVKVILPGINLYFFLSVSNQLAREDMFSKMAELIHDLLKMLMKITFGVTMGMNVVQGLIVPVTAQVKNLSVVRVSGAIPGIGNTVSSVAQTILCAGTLLKNAVGVTGMLVLFMICSVPFIHMLVQRFLYQFVSAAIQPVSDPRLVHSVSAAARAVSMLLQAVGFSAVLFVVSIAIISTMTTLL